MYRKTRHPLRRCVDRGHPILEMTYYSYHDFHMTASEYALFRLFVHFVCLFLAKEYLSLVLLFLAFSDPLFSMVLMDSRWPP